MRQQVGERRQGSRPAGVGALSSTAVEIIINDAHPHHMRLSVRAPSLRRRASSANIFSDVSVRREPLRL
jgi:hypothetical protein